MIVLERLKTDFANGSIFENDPVIPRELKSSGNLIALCGAIAERADAEGALFLTNIQQFYERSERNGDEEPDELTAILGPKPPTKKIEITDFGERIAKRAGHLLVVNDEAHHTHDEESEWNKVIRSLHNETPAYGSA